MDEASRLDRVLSHLGKAWNLSDLEKAWNFILTPGKFENLIITRFLKARFVTHESKHCRKSIITSSLFHFIISP